MYLGGNCCWVPLILAPPLNSPYWIYGVQYLHLQSQYNTTCTIITSEWPICDDFTWLVMKDAAPSQNLVTTKSSKPHNTVTFGYTVKKRSTFFNVKVPQLFFHLKPDTNVILRLKFWRINKKPLLELQSQLKLLGHFAVSLPSHFWCARFAGWVTCNKQHWKEQETGQKQKNEVEVSQLFLSEIVAPPYLLRKIKTESTKGHWVILIFSGQKSCTRII